MLSSTWLLAPYYNHRLSRVTTLISEYEAVGRPYSAYFRLADVLAALIIITCGWVIFKRKTLPKSLTFAIILIGLGLLIDGLSPVTCRGLVQNCLKESSILTWIHRVESTFTAIVLFYASYTFHTFKKTFASMAFIAVQVLYGLQLFSLTFVFHSAPSTLAQFAYQFIVSLFLVVMIRSGLGERTQQTKRNSKRLISALIGVLGVMVLGTHIIQARFLHLRRIAPYFSNHPVVLPSYSIAIGLGLVYLAFKLHKGEARSRILGLLLLFMNTLYFSVIRPQPIILILSLILFFVLYMAKADFDRNTYIPKRLERLKEVGSSVFVMTIALVSLVVIAAVFQVNKKPHFADTTDTVSIGSVEVLEVTVPKSLIVVFVTTSCGLLLWGLFRPARPLFDSVQLHDVELMLEKHSRSSEDYFKLWPAERKNYYWGFGGFICYCVVGSVAFALANPVCSEPNQLGLLKRFNEYCRSAGWTVCFLSVAEESLAIYKRAGLSSVVIGSTALVDCKDFTANTVREKWWRWRTNQANKLGYTYDISESNHAEKLIEECRLVSGDWLKRTGRREQGFAMGYFDESYLQKCSIHYLRDNSGKLIAFTNQVPTYSGRTATVDLMRFYHDTEGAMPFLLSEVIRHLALGNTFDFFDLGFVPFAGLNSRSSKIAKGIFSSRFSASGLGQFKNKFRPLWRKVYVAYEGNAIDLPVIARNLEKVMDV